MADDLNDMKERLKAAFNTIMDVAEEDLAVTTVTNRTLASDLFRTAAVITQTVADIEQRQAAQDLSARVEAVENIVVEIGQVVAGETKPAAAPTPPPPTIYPPRM